MRRSSIRPNSLPRRRRAQFGYNNDYVGYIAIEGSPEHGFLVVNHEYTNPHLMFPGLVKIVDGKVEQAPLLEGTGGYRNGRPWRHDCRNPQAGRQVATSARRCKQPPHHLQYRDGAERSTPPVMVASRPMPILPAPRFSARSTIVQAASHPGAPTSWPRKTSVASAIGELPEGHAETANYKRMGIPEGSYEWGRFYDRFDVSEPNEPNRFGWIVGAMYPIEELRAEEADRAWPFQHEGARSIVSKDGRVVFYLGDDERFDYVYKFVTAGKFNPDDRCQYGSAG